MRRCKVCGEEKGDDGFYDRAYRVGTCKVCANKRSTAWRLANPDRVRACEAAWRRKNRAACIAKQRRWRAEHPDRMRASKRKHLLKRHGLTVEAHAAMLSAQDRKCAICFREGGSTLRTMLVVDHDHGNGKVRSLLCQRCNRGIGLFRDDPRLLTLAATYLDRHARVA